MARRSRDWNEGLAQDLRNQEFAREFLLAAMDDGVPIQSALGKVIRAMGVKEFAGKARMASPNVRRAIHPRQNPALVTLNWLLTIQAQAEPGTTRETTGERRARRPIFTEEKWWRRRESNPRPRARLRRRLHA